MAKVIVVGSGIAGLLSACYAANKGHDVKVLTYGQGALSVAGGIIDVFGYSEEGKLIADPLAHISTLKKPHPYAMVGAKGVEEALEAFKALTAKANYTYIGDGHHNQIVPTAIGSFKPSCLIPPSINADDIFKCPKLLVVGFELLKDYYPKLIAKNLKEYFGESKTIDIRIVRMGWPTGRQYRDVSALDIARELEKPVGRLNVIEQLRSLCDSDTAVIIPPVLGENPQLASTIQLELETRLNTKFVEVSSIPPSVTGLRLDNLLLKECENLGIEIIEKAQVIGHKAENGICTHLLTGGYGRVREYKADAFIIATGGVFGDGLVTQMGRMYEPIFGIDIEVPQDQKDWSYQFLFCGKPQPFAAYGVSVNENLQPINKAGEVLFTNVQFAGRSLAGYDFCFEKSGNGVCVATAYHAVKQLDNVLQEREAKLSSLKKAQ